MHTVMKSLTLRHLGFAGISILLALALHNVFLAWLSLAYHNEQYSFLWMIPLITATLIYRARQEIFANTETAPVWIVLAGAGGMLCVVAHLPAMRLGPIDALIVAMVGVVVLWTGLFRLCYGRHAWRAARFPLAFMLFMVPIPQSLLESVIHLLQTGSALVVESLLSLLQVIHLRSGTRFVMPGLSIDIAPECSGFRSSMALLILVTLIAHYALRSRWRQLLLVASVIPLVLFKNGLRIVTLSLLAINVDQSFMTGSLHHRGGFVFFGLTLVILLTFCWLLKRSEKSVSRL